MKNDMQRAILESPFSGDQRGNRIFAENVARVMLYKGWNCFGSHLYYPHFLDENIPKERELGIEAGLQWSEGVTRVFFILPEHIDFPSKGMRYALLTHQEAGRDIICGICTHDGQLRHEVPVEWMFHEKGWRWCIRQTPQDFSGVKGWVSVDPTKESNDGV